MKNLNKNIFLILFILCILGFDSILNKATGGMFRLGFFCIILR